MPSGNALHIDHPTEIPFADLFAELEALGFEITITDYLDSLQLLAQLNPETPEEIEKFKIQLAAILCRNEEEQIQCYKVFDLTVKARLSKINNQADLARQLIQKRKETFSYVLKWLIISFSIIIPFVLLIVWINTYSPQYNASLLHSNELHAKENSSFQFEVSENYSENLTDKIRKKLYYTLHQKPSPSDYRITWFLNDSVVASDTLHWNYKFQKSGKAKLLIDYQSAHGHAKYEETINICNPLPNIDYITQLKLEKFDTLFLIKPAYYKDSILQWNVGDSIFNSAKDSIPVIMDEFGTWQVTCRVPSSECNLVSENSIIIIDPAQKHLTVTPSVIRPDSQQLLKSAYYILVGILLLLGFVLIGLHFYRKNKRRRASEEHQVSAIAPPIAQNKGLPLEVPFGNTEEFIQAEKFYLHLALEMLRRKQYDSWKLDIPSSIRSTIKNGELFTPAWTHRTKIRGFVFLIDASYPRGLHLPLRKFMIQRLTKNLVDINIYQFFRIPGNVFKHFANEEGMYVNMLNLHKEDVLVVCSDGYSFLDETKVGIKPEYLEKYNPWTHRVLVTPVPSKDWAINEQVLSTFFTIVPADVSGLLNMINLIDLSERPDAQKFSALYTTYSAKYVNFEEIDELEAYFENDTSLFQCLCAMALYPKIRWELTISLIHSIAPDKLTYASLLKIARIGWVNNGNFPGRIRLELLKRLSLQNELNARQTIIRALEQTELNETQLAFDEKQMQLTINKFVLFAHDPKSFPEYAEAEKSFLALYASNKIKDIPLRIYLDKKDPDYPIEKGNEKSKWENPLNLGNNPASLSEYTQAKTSSQQHPISKFWQHVILGGGILALSLAALLLISKTSTKGREILSSFQLTYEEIIVPEDWQLNFDFSGCEQAFINGNTWNLKLNSEQSNVIDTNLINPAIFNFALKNFATHYNQNITLQLTSSSGERLEHLFMATGDTIAATLSRCDTPLIKLDTLTIMYNDLSQKKVAEDMKDYLVSLGYSVPFVRQRGLNEENQIRYYRPDKKDEAQTLQNYLQGKYMSTFKLYNYEIPKPEIDSSILKIWIKNLALPNYSLVRILGPKNSRRISASEKRSFETKNIRLSTQYNLENSTEDVIELNRMSFKDSVQILQSLLKELYPDRVFKVVEKPNSASGKSANVRISELATTGCDSFKKGNSYLIYVDPLTEKIEKKSLSTLQTMLNNMSNNNNLWAEVYYIFGDGNNFTERINVNQLIYSEAINFKVSKDKFTFHDDLPLTLVPNGCNMAIEIHLGPKVKTVKVYYSDYAENDQADKLSIKLNSLGLNVTTDINESLLETRSEILYSPSMQNEKALINEIESYVKNNMDTYGSVSSRMDDFLATDFQINLSFGQKNMAATADTSISLSGLRISGTESNRIVNKDLENDYGIRISRLGYNEKDGTAQFEIEYGSQTQTFSLNTSETKNFTIGNLDISATYAYLDRKSKEKASVLNITINGSPPKSKK